MCPQTQSKNVVTRPAASPSPDEPPPPPDPACRFLAAGSDVRFSLCPGRTVGRQVVPERTCGSRRPFLCGPYLCEPARGPCLLDKLDPTWTVGEAHLRRLGTEITQQSAFVLVVFGLRTDNL